MSKHRNIYSLVLLTLMAIVISGCEDNSETPSQTSGFSAAPNTKPPGAIDAKFGDWEFLNGSYGGAVKRQITLWINVPAKLYDGEPNAQQRAALLAELTNICQSQFATDQIDWLAKSFEQLGAPEQLRVFLKYETAPQYTPDRKVFAHEATFKLANGKCNELLPVGGTYAEVEPDLFVFAE